MVDWGQLLSSHGLLDGMYVPIQHVTSRLVKEVLADIPKVVVDHAGAPKKEKKHVDTGMWKRIYKGAEVADKIASAGLNLCLEGIPMKKPKRPTIKVQNISLDKSWSIFYSFGLVTKYLMRAHLARFFK